MPAFKRVAIIQSNYIPWKGYFDILRWADLFIFYDDVQYTKNDWRNRNRIKTPKGTQWLTIPCGSSISRRICDVRIDSKPWQEDHWHQLQESYGNCPHWQRYAPRLKEIYLGKTWMHLSTLNQQLIRLIATEFLGCKTSFEDSQNFSLSGTGEARVLDLLKQAKATHYLSGPAAKNYIVPEHFETAGIHLTWMDYSGYREYPQPYPPFEHSVTILDLLFNVGPEFPNYLLTPPDVSASKPKKG